MGIIKNTITNLYQEIIVEYSFIGFKWEVVYRKRNGEILKYTRNKGYKVIDLEEYIKIRHIFIFDPPEIDKEL